MYACVRWSIDDFALENHSGRVKRFRRPLPIAGRLGGYTDQERFWYIHPLEPNRIFIRPGKKFNCGFVVAIKKCNPPAFSG